LLAQAQRDLNPRPRLCEVTDIFTTDAATYIQGDERCGSGTLANEEIRAFTTWNSKLSFVSA
jgi:hypothetical protein